jgi:hypothetical protein
MSLTIKKKGVPQAGIVTFLDVLGWKGVYDRQANAVDSLKRLVDSVRRNAERMRGRINSDVNVQSISDTIAIFTVCGDKEISKAIEIHGELCQWLIPESIQAALPMRGATAYGNFEISENIFVGKAVDEAASWHEQGNWIGVNLTPSAEFVFSKSGSRSAWVPYAAPIKTSMKWEPHCVNWLNDWTDLKGEKEMVRGKFRSMGPIVPEIAPKFINTLAFIDKMLDKRTQVTNQER